jgi:hypothetical protein
MVMSWVVVFDSDLTLKGPAHFEHGIFPKNHIDQARNLLFAWWRWPIPSASCWSKEVCAGGADGRDRAEFGRQHGVRHRLACLRRNARKKITLR